MAPQHFSRDDGGGGGEGTAADTDVVSVCVWWMFVVPGFSLHASHQAPSVASSYS